MNRVGPRVSPSPISPTPGAFHPLQLGPAGRLPSFDRIPWGRRCGVWSRLVLAWMGLVAPGRGLAAEGPRLTEEGYRDGLRPRLVRYCLNCHSTEKSKGDLDLERMTSLAEASRHPRVWQGVVEQVRGGEMPPKDKPQPPAAEREALLLEVDALLRDLAMARAGDPGPVVVRRLSNAEYTYTLRDLTGVDSLDPAREFPVDGAAGEGFMNVGQALVMSPTLLTKYLDAARELASHAVLLPDGFRFSASTSRRDWTDETVRRIRDLYARYTDAGGGTTVHLQGLEWETNQGGRLPLDRYLEACLQVRKRGGMAALPGVAEERKLSPKYLGKLWEALEGSGNRSPLLEALRLKWPSARREDLPALVDWVGRWQKALWRFSSVGHIGKVGGPKAWMEPVSPVVEALERRLGSGPAAQGVGLWSLVGGGDGDGDGGGGVSASVIWERPRWMAPGRPEIPVRQVRLLARELIDARQNLRDTLPSVLAAVAEVEGLLESGQPPGDLAARARAHGVDPGWLGAWLEFLGLGSDGPGSLSGHFTQRMEKVGGFDSVTGWGRPETPLMVVNRGDRAVRIPGNLPAGAVAVHPSPTDEAVVAWQSPVLGRLRVEGSVRHAHPECGNGVSWVLEWRRGPTRRRLAQGVAQGDKRVAVTVPEGEEPRVRPGDWVVLRVGPRDGNHSCDLTLVDLDLSVLPGSTAAGGGESRWTLSKEVVPDGMAANPHADATGRPAIWHFVAEPVAAGKDPGVAIPGGSLLARWRAEADADRRQALARELGALVRSMSPPPAGPDAELWRQMTSLGGPLFRLRWAPILAREPRGALGTGGGGEEFGLDPGLFGGNGVDPSSLSLAAGDRLDFRVPADLVEGMELVTVARLVSQGDGEVTAQPRVENSPAPSPAGGPSSGGSGWRPDQPVLVGGSAARARVEAAFADFRDLFPAALAYVRIVPVDEVVTLTLFHREDQALVRLMLGDGETAELERLWQELRFVSRDAFALVDAFAQLMEYATQDGDPKIFEPLREPIHARAAALGRRLVEAEAGQVDALVDFAARAYRRPLSEPESAALRDLYARLRGEGLAHADAFRTTLARVFVAPAFLYKMETPRPGAEPGPVSAWELATRLSYFLWSSAPDAALREAARSGRLLQSEELERQTRRMLGDAKVRRLAIEFGCQWLHVHGFDTLDEKSDRHFPTFSGLRGAMYEEAIRFFTDFFQENRPVAALLDSDHVFVNGPLAAHYGIPGVEGEAWQRVEGAHALGRGGILALSATLAKQSGASRTSPILRGNWLSEVLLGEKLPRPPKGVPQLPEDEAATDGLTVRELTERHSQDPRCAGCHVRIDPYGFALEAYDAIGRRRERDLGDRPIETRAKAADGAEFVGLDGLRDYLRTRRWEAFERQFCRKLLGYALGREVMVSDQPLLDSMRTGPGREAGRIAGLVEQIVQSRQFREIRGREAAED